MTNLDEREQFRAVMSRLASGVSVVAARDGRHDLAMTATSLVSVSLDPPTVLFCVHSDARIADAVAEGSRWAVSILGDQGLPEADWLASPGRPTLGQLARIPHTRAELSGAAVLQAAAAWLECETEWVRPAATHDVVVGRVLASHVEPARTGAIVHHLGRLRPLS